jgi:archaellum biogenesis ATPase FlaH
MGSVLVTTNVENLQNGINSVIQTFGEVYGIYISLNKTQPASIKALKKSKISSEKLFFIDCVSSAQEKNPEVINIKPSDLDDLTLAIKTFVKEIPERRYILIDSLATLMIYNDINKVANFIRTLTQFASQKGVELIVLTQKAEEEKLLEKVFNFFDNVEEK